MADQDEYRRELSANMKHAAAFFKMAAKSAQAFADYVDSNEVVTLPGSFPKWKLPPMKGQKFKEESEGEEGGKKKRKRVVEKKIKDPNAPKRPPSAYLLYQNEVRNTIKAQHPEMPYSEILGEISKGWSGLNEQQKKPYQDATELAKKKYDLEKADYDAKLAKEAGVTAAAAAATAAATPKVIAPATPASDSDDDSSSEESAPAKPPPARSPPKVKPKKKSSVLPPPPPPPAAESDSDSDDSDVEEEPVPPKKKQRKSAAPPPPVAAAKPVKADKKKKKA